MAFPSGWPPRAASSVRVYIAGTATASFADNAYLFIDVTSANPFLPTPIIPPGDETAIVKVGDLSSTGSPMGGGVQPPNLGVPGDGSPANVPKPQLFAQTLRIVNEGGADIEFSFDGANVHGTVKTADGEFIYRNRFEAGIAIRGAGADFRVEAW